MGPCQQKQLAEEIVKEYSIPVSRACKMTSVSRSGYYYKSQKNDEEVITSLQRLAEKNPAHGFPMMFKYLRKKGYKWNHKKVRRVYRLLKLNKPRKLKRRLPTRVKQPLTQQSRLNKIWSMDFMSDSLANGRKIRTFNVIDDCSREALVIEIGVSIPAPRVVRALNRLIEWRGRPETIRVDNGPEFTSHCFSLWAQENKINIQYIQPGKPMQNGFIERFNGTYRREVLDAYLFFELEEVQEATDQWKDEYNHHRPHVSLQNMTPSERAACADVDLMENFPMPQSSAEVYHNSTSSHNSNNNVLLKSNL